MGKLWFVPNDNDAYEILLYDRKSKKSSWNKCLFPIIIDGQRQIPIIPANLIIAKIRNLRKITAVTHLFCI